MYTVANSQLQACELTIDRALVNFLAITSEEEESGEVFVFVFVIALLQTLYNAVHLKIPSELLQNSLARYKALTGCDSAILTMPCFFQLCATGAVQRFIRYESLKPINMAPI